MAGEEVRRQVVGGRGEGVAVGGRGGNEAAGGKVRGLVTCGRSRRGYGGRWHGRGYGHMIAGGRVYGGR